MRITWRNKELKHQLDFRLEHSTAQIVAFCNCGEEFVRERIVDADYAIGKYRTHCLEVGWHDATTG